MKNKKQNHIDCYSKNGEIINKTKKEIDMIMEEMEKVLDIRKLAKLYWGKIPHPHNLIIDEEEIVRVLSVKFEKVATQILTKLKENQVVVAEGEIDNIKWESPYNKLIFYFKGLPKMIGIKIIKSSKVKIILKEINGNNNKT